jgi:hypothetical protein
MNVHILNGDALLDDFPYQDRVVVCRECLIDGPVDAASIQLFWLQRSGFICRAFDVSPADYDEKVKVEFDTLNSLNEFDTVNLWFEHDLFCQTNLWFCLYYLDSIGKKSPLFRVMPFERDADMWSGFANMQPHELQKCYATRVLFNPEDYALGIALWKAYASNNVKALIRLSEKQSPCFPMLHAVCKAHVDRLADDGRPMTRLNEIIQSGATDFDSIFKQFAQTEGIYGFGDLQVIRMLSKLNTKK